VSEGSRLFHVVIQHHSRDRVDVQPDSWEEFDSPLGPNLPRYWFSNGNHTYLVHQSSPNSTLSVSVTGFHNTHIHTLVRLHFAHIHQQAHTKLLGLKSISCFIFPSYVECIVECFRLDGARPIVQDEGVLEIAGLGV